MENSPFLVITQCISEIYKPVGDMDLTLHGLELGAAKCLAASNLFMSEEGRASYALHLEQIRQTIFMNGLRRYVHLHEAHLLMVKLVCTEDLEEHPAKWNELGLMLQREAARLRQQLSSSPGDNIVH